MGGHSLRARQKRRFGIRKRIAALLCVAAVTLLTGCTGAVAPRTPVADAVAQSIKARLGILPQVACEEAEFVATEGATLSCAITDREADETYDAAVVVVNVDDDGTFDVKLAVNPQN